jgi:O-antigen ligase
MRSVVEPSTDGSSLWRELENFNLIYTLKTSPLFGQGYGHRWIEVVQLPAVEYDLEYYLPHNSLLGLWASAGLLGYTAMTLLWGAGVYFAMRAYHAATVPPDRVAAILCVGAVMVYMVQCFGDLGLGSWTGVHILAPSLAMAGKLAVTTGSWREPTSKA